MNPTLLSVDEKLRIAAEGVLREGESLSDFVEISIRALVRRRQAQDAFIARGLASGDEARRSNTYYSADEVLRSLDSILTESTKTQDRGDPSGDY